MTDRDVTTETWDTWKGALPPEGLPDGICPKHWGEHVPWPASLIGRREKCDCDPCYLRIRYEGVGRLFFEAFPEPNDRGAAARRALLAAQAPAMYRLLEQATKLDLPAEFREQIGETLRRARGER